MDDLLDDISELDLGSLPNDWVDSAFLDEFIDFGDIPEYCQSNLESIEIQSVLQNLLASISRLDIEQITWLHLAREIAFRNLLALIGYCIKIGVINVTTSVHRTTALLAARVYFRLLIIPGARAYEVYHSQLFAHTISCLGFPKMMCEKSNLFSSNRILSDEVNHVLRALSEYVIDLKNVILLLKLTPNDINFEEILSNLLDVTGGSITQTLVSVDKIVMSNVSGMIYHVINCMLCNYGDRPSYKAIGNLFKCMLPKLIAVCGDNKAASNFVRASYVTYAGLIVTSYGKAGIRPFTTMLQCLCYNTELLDRAESRHTRSEVVVGLMSLLSDQRHRTFVKWLLVLAQTAKVLHRQMAVEVLARLLNNEPEINEQRATLWTEIEKQRVAAEALRNVTSDHSYVRQGARGGAEDVDTVENMDEGSQQANENEVPEEGEEEEEVSGILRQQAHTVPVGSILAALYECAQDSSSQVRSRALAVLWDSVASDRPHLRRAIEELNGEGDSPLLMTLVSRGVYDERAVVRRNGIVLLLGVLRTSQRALVPDDLTMLQGLCRDAAVTVRTAAINAIVELLVHRPSDVMVDSFLVGPMLQLSDPESKVSDVVKAHIEQLVMKRLAKYIPGNCMEDQLPWMVLQGIIRKKMKQNLDMACVQLARTEACISVRLVDILSSHLGVSPARDLQCLVLLTCMARHVAYSDVGFVIDLYYKITRVPEPESPPPRCADPRILQQTLDLLSSWSKYMKAPDRAALRNHIVTRLATGPDDGCRIMSATLAATLDPTNLIWATELTQLSERRAVEDRSLSEAVRAADLAMVTAAPPSLALVQMFVSCIQHPPPDNADAMMGLVVAGLGRVCLRSHSAAKVSAPALARVLSDSAAPLQARVNALLTLTDMSKRYTNVVEPLLDQMTACLRNSEPVRLRRAAARAITELLLAGFLRLRDTLYYKYVALLADSDGDVREQVEFFVTSQLTPDIICNNFVDCVRRYNRTDQGDIYLNFDARELVYDVMLQRLTMVQKLNVQCRLAQEVLVHAADLSEQEEDIPEDLHNALLDTIRILSGPRMRLPKKPQQLGETTNYEDMQERVTTNIVSHKMKITVAEVMIPAVMRLFTWLVPRGGQLCAYLVMLARELEPEYKDEIAELLKDDEELMERIAFFREFISVERGSGNARNLVAVSGPPEPETPRPSRRGPARCPPLKKRCLNI